MLWSWAVQSLDSIFVPRRYRCNIRCSFDMNNIPLHLVSWIRCARLARRTENDVFLWNHLYNIRADCY